MFLVVIFVFYFLGDILKQKVITLSEGQKGLLSMCCLVLQQPTILILDEPTNHINFRHLKALATAIRNFEGTYVSCTCVLLFVSCTYVIFF